MSAVWSWSRGEEETGKSANNSHTSALPTMPLNGAISSTEKKNKNTRTHQASPLPPPPPPSLLFLSLPTHPSTSLVARWWRATAAAAPERVSPICPLLRQSRDSAGVAFKLNLPCLCWRSGQLPRVHGSPARGQSPWVTAGGWILFVKKKWAMNRQVDSSSFFYIYIYFTKNLINFLPAKLQ